MTPHSIFITGCSSGIGLVSARHLEQCGYRVLAGCRRDEDLEKLRAEGFEAICIDMDDPASVDQAIAEVRTLTGDNLYALFNNAGFGLYGPLETISRAQLEHQFSTNLFGLHQLTIGLLPAMRKNNRGRIIQTSSMLGFVSTANRGAYAATKHALEAWSDALRLELRSTGIRVSLIEPGPLQTRFNENTGQTRPQEPVTNPRMVEHFRLGPEAVLPKLRHALESRRPKPRYRVTLVSHTLALLKRILPTRLLDALLAGN